MNYTIRPFLDYNLFFNFKQLLKISIQSIVDMDLIRKLDRETWSYFDARTYIK